MKGASGKIERKIIGKVRKILIAFILCLLIHWWVGLSNKHRDLDIVRHKSLLKNSHPQTGDAQVQGASTMENHIGMLRFKSTAGNGEDYYSL